MAMLDDEDFEQDYVEMEEEKEDPVIKLLENRIEPEDYVPLMKRAALLLLIAIFFTPIAAGGVVVWWCFLKGRAEANKPKKSNIPIKRADDDDV